MLKAKAKVSIFLFFPIWKKNTELGLCVKQKQKKVQIFYENTELGGWYQIGQSEESDEGIGKNTQGTNPSPPSKSISKKIEKREFATNGLKMVLLNIQRTLKTWKAVFEFDTSSGQERAAENYRGEVFPFLKSRFLLSGQGGHCSLSTVSFKVIRLLEILAKQRRKELQAERSRGAENEVQKGRRQNTSEIQDGEKQNSNQIQDRCCWRLGSRSREQ